MKPGILYTGGAWYGSCGATESDKPSRAFLCFLWCLLCQSFQSHSLNHWEKGYVIPWCCLWSWICFFVCDHWSLVNMKYTVSRGYKQDYGCNNGNFSSPAEIMVLPELISPPIFCNKTIQDIWVRVIVICMCDPNYNGSQCSPSYI